MLQIGRDAFVITSPFTFVRPGGTEVTVCTLQRGDVTLGFVTDGATKPKIVMAIIGTHTDEGFPGYVVHDWLYRAKPFGDTPRGRAISDLVLLEALEACKMRRLKRHVIYRTVRLFGGFWFNARPAIDLEKITAETKGPDYYAIPTGTYAGTLRFRILALKDKSGTTTPRQTHENAQDTD
jgi:hypothetical protein